MTIPRKKAIPKEQLEIIKKVSQQVKQLRLDKNLSIEQFCYTHRIPRITYGNLESGKSGFQITTLLSVLEAHQIDLKTFIKKI